MKLIKVVKKSDSTSFKKCDRWAQDLFANSLNSLPLPNYIISHCKGMDLHEAEDVLETLEDSKKQFEKVLANLNNAIKAVEAQG